MTNFTILFEEAPSHKAWRKYFMFLHESLLFDYDSSEFKEYKNETIASIKDCVDKMTKQQRLDFLKKIR